MDYLPLGLLLFCWLSSEQERFIGNFALSGEYPPPDDESRFFVANPYRRNLSFLMLAIYAFCRISQTAPLISGWLAFAVSFAFIARLQDWHCVALWKNKNVMIYYFALWVIILNFFILASGWLFLAEIQRPAQQGLIFTLMLWFILSLWLWRTWAKH